MRRYLLAAGFAVAAVAIVVGSADALMIAIPQPGQLAATSPVVVTGKITAITNDTVEAAAPFAGSKEKQKYKIATVKIDTGLSGIDGAKVKEIKIGFIPQPVGGPARPGRPIRRAPELKEGQEAIFFLAKHPTADFYVIPGISAPFDLSNPEGKKALEEVKKVTATLADPMKGLKSDKADVRAETAAILVTKYRAYPPFGGETEEVALPADESKLILKALTEGDWQAARIGGAPNPFMAFNRLGLSEKDGWVQPIIVNVPGQPGRDYAAVTKGAFGEWLNGPGKDYRIKKVVAKTGK